MIIRDPREWMVRRQIARSHFVSPLCVSLGLAMLLVLLAPARAMAIDFEAEVRPLLEARCVSCHGALAQKGGLRLDTKGHALMGGDGGPAIVAGRSAESELIRRVSTRDTRKAMPRKGERLTEAEVALLVRWVDGGAPWPETEADRKASRDPRLDHWAWQPIARPPVPSPAQEARARGDIDRFVLARLEELSLASSLEADRRTLIRRLSFDLTGLPPTPEEVAAFEADESPDAYEQLVDRLLRSPRHGERWARHWLDVVHYGDTHGYDKDKPRPNAWPYRDYVIRAFNEDKPYARFIEEQIAGDVLYPGSRDGNEALGFIAAGPWDFIGHAEVPESKIDGKVARHLDRDDMVANTIGTFASVTIHCAQCHNHKFDPFTQEDYYSLQAVFAAVDRADRKYFVDEAKGRRYEELEGEARRLEARRGALEATIRERAGPPLVELEKRIEAASRSAKGAERAEFGYHSAISASQEETKWVQVDLGQTVAMDRIVLFPCHDDFNGIGAGFGFPVRFRVEVSDDTEFRVAPRQIAVLEAADVPGTGTTPRTFPAEQARGRHVRVTATKLAPRQNDFIFALAELQVLDAEGRNLARSAAVSSLDSIEAPPRWQRINLVDGIAPAPDSSGELVALQAERAALLQRATDEATSRELAEVGASLSKVKAELEALPPPNLVYAGTVHTGSGAFTGTGANGGKPRTISILTRGSVNEPGREVGPGAIAALPELPGRFDVPADHPEGERRAALARWLADDRNPLTWRSIVNRVWQYHFGRGLVEMANDFGRMGAEPTHPALLDWLASDFRDHGGSLKRLHKMIVMSAAYRQRSDVGATARVGPGPSGDPQGIDADNRYLWRQNRRKLEAEAVHDAVLAISGKLDLTMGGPGYQDFVIEQPEHSPHYQYSLADPSDPRTMRRSIYRFIVRSQTQPFMTSLDCADPSMRVEKRNESVSALQALTLLNNGFMVTQAAYFADRLRREAGGEPAAQVARAHLLALGRLPTSEERDDLVKFAQAAGLENLCRVLINLNEFSFVD